MTPESLQETPKVRVKVKLRSQKCQMPSTATGFTGHARFMEEARSQEFQILN